VLADELVRENSHQIRVDVHGKFCRLLDEAEQVSKSELRSKIGRLDSNETPTSFGSSTYKPTMLTLAFGLVINSIMKSLNLLNTR
jgi:hypothetical protein